MPFTLLATLTDPFALTRPLITPSPTILPLVTTTAERALPGHVV